jgi:ferredoxin
VKVDIEQDKCIGAGQCVLNAPDVFDQDDDTGIAFLIEDAPGPELQASARLAMQICPAAAIHLRE